MNLTNINQPDWVEGKSKRGSTWRFVDLSGERLGVRIEEMPPGGTSSVHHYHTLEEEHVIVLEGNATLFLGSDRHALGKGDHIWFAAGKEEAHHIENTSAEVFKFLVFGERNQHDVVIYPEQKVMMVKALERKLFTYRPVEVPSQSNDE